MYKTNETITQEIAILTGVDPDVVRKIIDINKAAVEKNMRDLFFSAAAAAWPSGLGAPEVTNMQNTAEILRDEMMEVVEQWVVLFSKTGTTPKKFVFTDNKNKIHIFAGEEIFSIVRQAMEHLYQTGKYL